MRHRIVIETMGDGSERVFVQRLNVQPTLLQRVLYADRWETLGYTETYGGICIALGMGMDIISGSGILFPSVEVAKQFIDAVLLLQLKRTVVATKYEEYPT